MSKEFEGLPPTQPWIAAVLVAVSLAALCSEVCRGAEPVTPRPFTRPGWGAGVLGNRADFRVEFLADRCQVLAWTPSRRYVLVVACHDTYSGRFEILTSRQVALDHEYPAEKAWHAREWRDATGAICETTRGCTEYLDFYRDPRNLTPTTALANKQKGDRGPGSWCPESRAELPRLAKRYWATVRRYRFPVTPRERMGLLAWSQRTCLVGTREVGR